MYQFNVPFWWNWTNADKPHALSSKKIPEFQILHIDAHSDLYDNYEGDPFSHACPFARIMDSKLTAHLTQIGIRTLNPHQKAQAAKYNVTIQEMKDFNPSNLNLKDMPVYISLDMDSPQDRWSIFFIPLKILLLVQTLLNTTQKGILMVSRQSLLQKCSKK